MNSKWHRKLGSKLLFYIPLALTLVFVLVPFLWAISTSLKREGMYLAARSGTFQVRRPSRTSYMCGMTTISRNIS